MERGDNFHRFRGHANPPSALNATDADVQNVTAADLAAAVAVTRNSRPPASAAAATLREQDQYMPIANVIRIMRRILPPHAKISDDAKETIQECVSEYISFVTGEANERCQREQRKTVTAEDVLWAMGKLGFDDYIEPLTVFLNRYREIECERTSLRGEPFMKRTVDYAPAVAVPPPPAVLPPYMTAPPGFHPMGPPGAFDGSAAVYYRVDPSGGAGDGGATASSSSSSSHAALLHSFDPYAQFK
ncbi:nuclear transcription factor Y subunit B-9-like [Punica granatum]|uniref:Nuclear transcription factor Y subunit B-9-like n=1 Tax=Punica granatum TaxID=22663 RepID=A0A6P8EHF3_PUNGR|nr:nuclear transcription factor Y subunit B-9-like [Punica granatum]